MCRTVFASVVFLFLLAACGGEEQSGEDKRGDPGPGPVPPQTAPDRLPGEGPPPAEPEEACDEVTNLEIVFGDEKEPVPAFELTHTAGFIAGMRYNAKRTAKLAYIVLANYEPKLTSYNVDPPKEEGQVAILLTFKTESKDVPFENQMAEYAKMRVPVARYGPGWMKREASFQVSYYVGGKMSGPAISGGGAAGEATLTHSTANLVCGSIDFTSEAGTKIKGTFSVEIEKDMWAK